MKLVLFYTIAQIKSMKFPESQEIGEGKKWEAGSGNRTSPPTTTARRDIQTRPNPGD